MVKSGTRAKCPKELPDRAKLTARPRHFSNHLLIRAAIRGTDVPPKPIAAKKLEIGDVVEYVE